MSTVRIDTAFNLLSQIKVGEKLLVDLQNFDEQCMSLEVRVNDQAPGPLSDYAKGLKQHMLDNLPTRIIQLKQEFNALGVTAVPSPETHVEQLS